MPRGKKSFAEIEVLCQQPAFLGFTGVFCTNCGSTVNVIYGEHWSCPNCNSFNGAPREQLPLHEKPDCGNTATEISVVATAYSLERIWSSLPEDKRLIIIEAVLGGILLQRDVLKEKTVLEIENILDSNEFQCFHALVLATQAQA